MFRKFNLIRLISLSTYLIFALCTAISIIVKLWSVHYITSNAVAVIVSQTFASILQTTAIFFGMAWIAFELKYYMTTDKKAHDIVYLRDKKRKRR